MKCSHIPVRLCAHESFEYAHRAYERVHERTQLEVEQIMFCRGVAEEAAGKSHLSASKQGRGWLQWGLRWVRPKNGAKTHPGGDSEQGDAQDGEDAEKDDDEPFTQEQVRAPVTARHNGMFVKDKHVNTQNYVLVVNAQKRQEIAKMMISLRLLRITTQGATCHTRQGRQTIE
jgi:hypothetical protein